MSIHLLQLVKELIGSVVDSHVTSSNLTLSDADSIRASLNDKSELADYIINPHELDSPLFGIIHELDHKIFHYIIPLSVIKLLKDNDDIVSNNHG